MALEDAKMSANAAEQERGYRPLTRAIGGIPTIDALDRRTRAYRRYEAIRGAVLSDMGGEENTSEIKRQLISKFATICLQLEVMEAAAIAGETIDADAFGRISGHARRIAETLGMSRRPREITPSVADYVAHTTADEASVA
jgi:hypothetical protein